MRFDDDIVQITVHQVGLAIVGLIGWTGLHIAELAPSRWKLRRAGTRLKALETLVRRLITLMALRVEMEERKPRPRTRQTKNVSANHAADITDGSGGDVSSDAPDSIEDITFPKPRQRSLTLLMALMNFSERPDFSHFPRSITPVEITAKRFTRRIVALQRVLEAPEAHAKRLARSLQKIRTSVELKPVVAPASVPSGLAPEIGALHGGIAFELRETLKRWASERPEIDPGDRFQRGRPRQGP